MKSWFFASILLMTCASYGGQETHGGNGFAAEFFTVYDSFLSHQQSKECLSKISSFNSFAALLNLRKELRVTSQPTVEWNGEQVGAINFPKELPRLVILSEEKWKNSNEDQRRALVIHELFHLIGLDDRAYQYSSQVINCLSSIEEKIRLTSETSNILMYCDRKQIQSLTRLELLNTLVINGFFFNGYFSSLLVGDMCIEGVMRLKSESLFKCSKYCQSLLCGFSDNLSSTMKPEKLDLKTLDFLEAILKNLSKETQIQKCSWNICDRFSIQNFDFHPEIYQLCFYKKMSVPK